MQRLVTVDLAPAQWREKSASGSGARIRIFDGKELLTLEDGGDEFIRAKRNPKDDAPLPSLYDLAGADWPKATELERRPCGLKPVEHTCVILNVPLKPWLHDANRMVQGVSRLSLDTETGLLLAVATVEAHANKDGSYQMDLRYNLKSVTYGAPAEAGAFALPAGLREVKELTRWNAARIRKQLAGKPAPELAVVDIAGKPLTLAAFKGRTVLLDFWTTWCPPCRADAPALDKLYRKYGERELMIVSVSVSELRAVVEPFLKDHPHSFPIVLTTENEMPLPYQISTFPTYIVIGRDGAVTSAVEGDQGFGELRALLKKAGLEVE